MNKIIPCLWFDYKALEAVEFYTNIFPESSIGKKVYYDDSNPYGKPGEIMTIEFNIMGNEFLALNGGPIFTFSPATSFMIPCKNQDEIEYYYDKLSHVVEAEQCGWLADKFGVSWQLNPENLDIYMSDKNKEKAGKMMKALLDMKRIDMNELEKIYNS